MAEDKPKIDTFREFLKNFTSKTPVTGLGTKILLDPDTDAEKIAFLNKLLEGYKPEKVVDLLKWLQEQVEQTTEAIQKKAAETNVVDEVLANQWLTKHWKSRNCTICGEVTWAMAPQFAHISFARPGVVGAPLSFPCVVLTCRVCGNTLFFNAVTMQLLPEGTR